MSYLSTVILTEIMFLVIMTQFVPLMRDIPVVTRLFFALTGVLTVTLMLIMILESLLRRREAKREAAAAAAAAADVCSTEKPVVTEEDQFKRQASSISGAQISQMVLQS